MLHILIKLITIATLLCVAFFLYYDVKALKEMLNIAYVLGKARGMSKFIIFCACLITKQFLKTLFSCMLNLFCIILLLMILFM